MNRTNWIKLTRWYDGLHVIQQWLFKVMLALTAIAIIAIVTREPGERPRQSRIILNCFEGCGSDPERTITYNQYMDRKEQQQRTWFREERQRIQQEARDERGRQRWCREHPQDRNCQ